MIAKHRERAALLCSAAASNPREALYVFESVGFDARTVAIVESAIATMTRCMPCKLAGHTECRLMWAEAEALIRCGWVP